MISSLRVTGAILIILIWMFSGCSPEIQVGLNISNTNSNNTSIQDSTIISEPKSPFLEGPVYISGLAITKADGVSEIVISGHLPEGCSELYILSYTIKEGHLEFTLNSWRPRDAMCMQMLVDFDYSLKGVPENVISELKSWSANEESGSF